MYRILVLFACVILFFAGCSQNADSPKNDKEQTDTVEAENDETKNEAKEKPDRKEVSSEKNEEKQDEANFTKEDLAKDHLAEMEPRSIDSPFGEDGNIKNEHTEREIVEEHMDENGRIYFDVDENPIRSIVSEDGNISNITNYYDAYIDVLESEAYELPEDKHKETAYNMFISHPPEELAGKDPSEYRSWEEATNLERGIIQITYFAAPPLNEIGYSIQEDNYTDGAFNDARKKLEDLGSPNVLIPAPQSVYDMQLYKNMQQVHSLWGQIGQFENPDENRKEFQQVYQQLRDEMNNIIVRVNFTLSEDPNGNDDPSKEK